MIYDLDTSSSPNALIPWVYIFRSLSIPQFQDVYNTLNFPVAPSEDLRQLSHDFVIAYEINLGNSVSETASIDLLQGILPNDEQKKRVKTLFTNVFLYLERMGYAESIYYWGRHTSDYFEHEAVQQLSAWCSLLLKWAILEQERQPLPTDHKLPTDDWNDVVAKWTPIYTRVPPEPFEHMTFASMPLSEESGLALRASVLRYEAERMHFETTLEQILAAPKSTWEDSILRPGGSYMWIKSEGKFRINLREWNAIVEMLSKDEMTNLEQWGLKDTYHKLKSQILNFAL